MRCPVTQTPCPENDTADAPLTVCRRHCHGDDAGARTGNLLTLPASAPTAHAMRCRVGPGRASDRRDLLSIALASSSSSSGKPPSSYRRWSHLHGWATILFPLASPVYIYTIFFLVAFRKSLGPAALLGLGGRRRPSSDNKKRGRGRRGHRRPGGQVLTRDSRTRIGRRRLPTPGPHRAVYSIPGKII